MEVPQDRGLTLICIKCLFCCDRHSKCLVNISLTIFKELCQIFDIKEIRCHWEVKMETNKIVNLRLRCKQKSELEVVLV